jgi:hypothetical protein
LLEDPDFAFQDLVCLMLCFYYGELKIHASSFNKIHSARGMSPDPTQLRLTTETSSAAQLTDPGPDPAEWYKDPAAAARLSQERALLEQKYQVEPSIASGGRVYLRLTPRHKYETVSFYLACESGFPRQAPRAFMLAGEKPYPLSCLSLSNWSERQTLVAVADELLEWLAFAPDEYIASAEQAMSAGDYTTAVDLLMLVLKIEPRTARAPRLLAQAQAALRA